jgi:hypothetical protein
MIAVRSMWAELTWRKVLVSQGVGVSAVLAEYSEYSLLGTWMGHPSMNYVAMAVTAFALLLMTLYADELVSRGVRGSRVYPALIVAVLPLACVVTALTQWIYFVIFQVPQAAIDSHRWVWVSTAVDIAIISAFAMIVYINRQTADRVLEGIQGSELRRVQLEQQLVESRLATAEAQVDPRMLFSSLADIRDGFQQSDPDADAKLDNLVQHLRTSLVRTVSAANADPVKT